MVVRNSTLLIPYPEFEHVRFLVRPANHHYANMFLISEKIRNTSQVTKQECKNDENMKFARQLKSLNLECL